MAEAATLARAWATPPSGDGSYGEMRHGVRGRSRSFFALARLEPLSPFGKIAHAGRVCRGPVPLTASAGIFEHDIGDVLILVGGDS